MFHTECLKLFNAFYIQVNLSLVKRFCATRLDKSLPICFYSMINKKIIQEAIRLKYA